MGVVGDAYYVVFFLYIAFWNLVIINALNGLFVDSVMTYSSKDQTALAQQKLKKKQQFMAMISEFFTQIADEYGQVSLERFQQHLNDARLVEFAEGIDIDPCEMEFFFTMISSNGTRTVDLETFVVGCIKLVGMARSMDMVDNVLTVKKLSTDFSEFSDYVQKQFHTRQRSEHLTQQLITTIQQQLQRQAHGCKTPCQTQMSQHSVPVPMLMCEVRL